MDFKSLIEAGNTQPGGFCRVEAEHTRLDGPSLGLDSNNQESQRALTGRSAWHINEEMMHQPWGRVLKVLGPATFNKDLPLNRGKGQLNARAKLDAHSRLVPKVGDAHAYTHSSAGKRLAPAPGTHSQYAALSARRPSFA